MNIQLIPAEHGPKLTVFGDRQFIKITAAETHGGCSVIEQISAPGSRVPLHVHTREDEVFQVLEGSVKIDLGGKLEVVGPGTTVFLPRRVPHGFEIIGTTPARLLIIVTPGGLEEMFAELDRLPPGPPDFKIVTAICERFGIRFLPARPATELDTVAAAP